MRTFNCGLARQCAFCWRIKGPVQAVQRSAALASLQQPPGRRRHSRCRRGSTLVVATSEYWYEDEEEFDAMTDAMRSKHVVLVAAPAGVAAGAEGGVDSLRSFVQPLTFNQAFSSSQALPFAQQLWSGRDGAPYFLKVRIRQALDDAGTGAADAQAAAADVWRELLQQNWKVELDAGLGGAAQEQEALLLVCSPAAVVELLAAAGVMQPAAGDAPREGSVTVLHVEGTQAGDPLDWQKLDKRVALAAVVPAAAAASDVLAALGHNAPAPTN